MAHVAMAQADVIAGREARMSLQDGSLQYLSPYELDAACSRSLGNDYKPPRGKKLNHKNLDLLSRSPCQ